MFKTLGLAITIAVSASAVQWGPTLMELNERRISNLEEQTRQLEALATELRQNNEKMREVLAEMNEIRDRYTPRPLGAEEKRKDKHYASDLEEKLDIEMGYVNRRMDTMASRRAVFESYFWQHVKSKNSPNLGPIRPRNQ